MESIGCATVTPGLGLIVGGNQFANGISNDVYLFTASDGSLEQISSLEDQTIGMVCYRTVLSGPAEKLVIICTGGRFANSNPSGKTYVYDITTGVFEKRLMWDFPAASLGEAMLGHLTHDRKMTVQTASGVYLFKGGELSQATGSYWHKMDVNLPIGFSAPFNLRYAGPVF